MHACMHGIHGNAGRLAGLRMRIVSSDSTCTGGTHGANKTKERSLLLLTLTLTLTLTLGLGPRLGSAPSRRVLVGALLREHRGGIV